MIEFSTLVQCISIYVFRARMSDEWRKLLGAGSASNGDATRGGSRGLPRPQDSRDSPPTLDGGSSVFNFSSLSNDLHPINPTMAQFMNWREPRSLYDGADNSLNQLSPHLPSTPGPMIKVASRRRRNATEREHRQIQLFSLGKEILRRDDNELDYIIDIATEEKEKRKKKKEDEERIKREAETMMLNMSLSALQASNGLFNTLPQPFPQPNPFFNPFNVTPQISCLQQLNLGNFGLGCSANLGQLQTSSLIQSLLSASSTPPAQAVNVTPAPSQFGFAAPPCFPQPMAQPLAPMMANNFNLDAAATLQSIINSQSLYGTLNTPMQMQSTSLFPQAPSSSLTGYLANLLTNRRDNALANPDAPCSSRDMKRTRANDEDEAPEKRRR